MIFIDELLVWSASLSPLIKVKPQLFTPYLHISEYIDCYMVKLYELFVEDFYIAGFAEALEAMKHITKDEVYRLDCFVCLCALALEQFLKADFLFLTAL